MKRSISSAIVAVALLAGVACSSSGSGLTPRAGAKITLPTPKSVSPASVKTAPMATTAIQPASSMLSRHPATAVNPPSWAQIPGSASEVSAGADGSIWILSDGTGDRAIWHYTGGAWTNISGAAIHISAAPDGTLYAVNATGGVYAYTAGNWTSLGGGATDVAAAADSSLYVISNSGIGDRGIWHYASGNWTQAPGQGVSLAGSLDTSTHVVGLATFAPGGVYVLTTAGAIYYLNTDDSYAQLPAQASMVASFPGGVFALGGGGIQPGGNPIYYFDLDTPGWTVQAGSAIGISAGTNGDLYAVSASGAIYQTFAGTPAPRPTGSPTDGPTASPSPTDPPTATPTDSPTATPSPAASATAIPAYAFAGPGDSCFCSGGIGGDFKPFGSWHNIGYTQISWSHNLNGSAYLFGVETAVNSGDVYLNGTPTPFPADDAVPGATPIIYYQFSNDSAFPLVFTSTLQMMVNYLVPFPGTTCYVDQYALANGASSYAWITTGVSGTPFGTAPAAYVYEDQVYLNGGSNFPFPPGKTYYAISCS